MATAAVQRQFRAMASNDITSPGSKFSFFYIWPAHFLFFSLLLSSFFKGHLSYYHEVLLQK